MKTTKQVIAELKGQTLKAEDQEANPYGDNGCPICGGHAVSSCRCGGPHSFEQLKKGHGLRCKNGHHFNNEGLAYDKTCDVK